MHYVVPFDEYLPELRPQLGGKNASLGEMTRAGLPVPPGFAITTTAFTAHFADPDLRRDLAALLAEADPRRPEGVEPVSQAVRARVEAAPLAADLTAAVAAAYDRLCERCQTGNAAVAVRSSATCEDAPDASFAGEHDSFLWVRGPADIARHVLRCWSSLWTARAICYRAQSGYGDTAVAMSVGVQKMVRPIASGVAFTLNPSNGDRSQVAIDANWGLGEPVVSGEVTPDHYLVDKVLYEITERHVSHKTVELAVDGDTIRRVELTGDRADPPCLSDSEIKAVARLARQTERHYGCPQDIEWALDSELASPDNVVLLQSRPETVWSRRERPPVATSTNVMDSIVSTLCAPIHTRTQPAT
ncbi:MAG TPA: PEP/pyruvate-binding domain-containing protein [Acidimicrobiia bacterium]|nr:PEP/pyruvate-binding domain-containing protein [Acidimicrobiia bacterium]